MKAQQIIVTDKKTVTIGSVASVRSFDEEEVILDSSLGLISIEGSELRIENFEKATSELLVVGNISGVFYLEKKDKKKGRIAFK